MPESPSSNPPAEKNGLPILAFPDGKAWGQWLAEHHAEAAGLWLKLAKKDSGIPSVTYEEAVTEGLRFGWIDSQKAGLDEQYWLQRFTPRRAKSKWSQINRKKAEELIAAGRMQPAGLREVERARADGRWDAAYAGQATMPVPEDFTAALEQDPAAQAFFADLDSRNRYAILYQIEDAKRPATRARRIAKFVAMLAKGEKLYP